jgi:hypothetical protein
VKVTIFYTKTNAQDVAQKFLVVIVFVVNVSKRYLTQSHRRINNGKEKTTQA